MLKELIATAAIAASMAAPAAAQNIEVFTNGSRPTSNAPDEYFTGTVMIDSLLGTRQDTAVGAGHVTFSPGARSAWHTHPKGQMLIVTAGTGWVQQWGGSKREIKPGDIVWIPPGVKHWHGATAANAMRHIAVQEAVDGKNVNWLEKVTDDQYDARN